MTERTVGVLTEQEVFFSHFPGGRVFSCAELDIPQKTMEFFEKRSRLFVDPKNYVSGNFSRFYVIEYKGGAKTYVTIQTKTYDTTNGATETLTYLYDADQNEAYVGHGEIRMNNLNPHEFFKDKPFVGFTYTDEEKTRNGLGRRRLLVMNALCQMLYGLPLNSDTIIGDAQKRLWEKLAEEGKVQKYKEGHNDRFVFV